jgi:hypothetical protein
MSMLDPHGILRDPKMHPDLVSALHATMCSVQFQLTTGGRTQAQEDSLVARHLSQTHKSRHVYEQNAGGLCCAVDWVCIDTNGSANWNVGDPETGIYATVGNAIVAAGAKLGIKIQWGGAQIGAWTDGVVSHFHDWDHVQLDPSHYPLAS